jgi:integrase
MLTDASIRKFKSTTKAREISDGPSGLRLMIHPRYLDAKGKPRDGTKAWIMRFRRPNGKPAKLTLGRVYIKEANEDEPSGDRVLGGLLTLRAARRLAAEIAQRRAQNVDVIADYAAQKSRDRAEAEDAAANTFTKLAIDFVRDYRVRRWGTRPRRWRETALILGLKFPKDCADPAKAKRDEIEVIKGSLSDSWRAKSIDQIDGHAIYVVLAEAKKKGIAGLERRNREESDNRARKMRSALSVFFKWAEEHRKITTNPCLGVWKPRAPESRERTLTDAEIKKFMLAVESVPQPVRSLLRVLLFTGQRLNEVRGMCHTELDRGTWTIPSARAKNHRANVLVLPKLVGDLIAEVPRVQGNPFVFVGATGSTPITIGSKIKATIDGTMGADILPWRFHDLRRTCASGMLRLGIRLECVERVLNHVSGSFAGVAGTYARDPLTEEVGVALLRWSQHVVGLVEGSGDKVVALRTKANDEQASRQI